MTQNDNNFLQSYDKILSIKFLDNGIFNLKIS